MCFIDKTKVPTISHKKRFIFLHTEFKLHIHRSFLYLSLINNYCLKYSLKMSRINKRVISILRYYLRRSWNKNRLWILAYVKIPSLDGQVWHKSEFKFIHHISFSFQITCERHSNLLNFVSLITTLFHWDVYVSTFAQHTRFIFPMMTVYSIENIRQN